MAEPAALRRTPVVPAAEGLRLLEPAARFILRAEARAIRSAGAALGIDVLSTPCRASRGQTRSMLWLGPDEYLLLAPQVEAPTVAGAVEGALQAEPHALVDVSHRQTALELSGARAPDILNGAFPVDMCTRTVFAKAEIVLWRTAPDVFRLEVWRSFTDYVARFICEVVSEY